jgi:hypothetical protein
VQLLCNFSGLPLAGSHTDAADDPHSAHEVEAQSWETNNDVKLENVYKFHRIFLFFNLRGETALSDALAKFLRQER